MIIFARARIIGPKVRKLTCAVWHPQTEHGSLQHEAHRSALMIMLKFWSASPNQILESNEVLQHHGQSGSKLVAYG